MLNQKTTLVLALFSVLTGFTGSFGFPSYNLFFLGLISYGALFIIVEQASSIRQTSFLALLWGLSFHVGGLWWIAQALLVEGNPYRWAYPLAVVGLPLLLSMFTILFCCAYKKVLQAYPVPKVLAALLFATLFSISEWLRGNILTGFPWNLPAYVWSNHLELLQSLSVISSYGLSTLTLFLSVMFAAFCVKRDWPMALPVIALIFLFMGFHAWGKGQLKNKNTNYSKSLARIIQPNIQQKEKWNPDLYLAHLDKIKNIATSDLSSLGNFDNILLVLPETAMNDKMLAQAGAKDLLNDLSNAYTSANKNLVVLSGALHSETNTNGKAYFNSAFLFNSNGRVLDDYSKSHLVPFGEYIPFSNVIDIAPVVGFSGFTAGDGPKTIYLDRFPSLGIAICYEIIFPRKFIDQKDKPQLIITITNDAWYGNTPGPYQHYMMARYRAIEERITVLRSANTGISGGFDAYGRELDSLGINKEGYLDIPLVF